MNGVIAAIKEAGAGSEDPTVRNIVERLLKHLEGKAPRRGEPIVVLISTAIGGVVQTVERDEALFELIPVRSTDDTHDAERFAGLFRAAGLTCELKRRVPRPPKPRKGQSPAPATSAKGDIVHVLYLPG